MGTLVLLSDKVYIQITLTEDPNIVDSQSYYYANTQLVSRLDQSSDPNNNACYYYLSDRLGSIRLMLDTDAAPINSYTYDPFGNQFESEAHETIGNPYQFAGYRWDEDADMFYCNARWYNPEIYRFTGRDPMRGKLNNPLSLHAYLYCMNDSVNHRDPDGKLLIDLLVSTAIRTYNNLKDAAMAKTLESSMKNQIIGLASIANGVTQGWMNVLFGPSDMSDGAKLAVGFVAGFGEMQVGLRTESAALGAFVSSSFTSAANAAWSNDNSLGVKDIISIGLATAVGGMADYVSEGGVTTALEMWMVGTDAALWNGVAQKSCEEVSQW